MGMLKYFEVENFKGFKDTFSMDLSMTKQYEFNAHCISNNIARFAQLYGPNASGKTNLGVAILDISSHLTDNYVQPTYYQNYLNADSECAHARFKYVFIFGEDEIIYEYKKTDRTQVDYEELKINKEIVIKLDRVNETSPYVGLSGAETLILDDINRSSISLVKFISRNTILSESIHQNLLFKKFVDFVKNMLFFRSLQDTSFIGFTSTIESIFEYLVKNNLVDDLQSQLKEMGIDYNLVIMEDAETSKNSIFVKFENKTKSLWDISSTGTRAILLFYYWYAQIKDRGETIFVFIDEFDAFYHYQLSEKISTMLAKLIQHQVILTTHNTGQLCNEISRPDCNFLLNKNKILPLWMATEKDLRFAHNIEKIYRAGGFNEQ